MVLDYYELLKNMKKLKTVVTLPHKLVGQAKQKIIKFKSTVMHLILMIDHSVDNLCELANIL